MVTRPLVAKAAYYLAAALIGAAVALVAVVPAEAADYTPSHYNTPGMPDGGAVISDIGSLDANNTAYIWNVQTGAYELWSQANATGCGSTYACAVFAYEGTVMSINGDSCSFPAQGSGTWATTYTDYGTWDNLPSGSCGGSGGSSTDTAVYVISVNDSIGFSSDNWKHIARHELGHALELGHPSSGVSCWYEGSVYMPLMKNTTSGCPNFGTNYTATPNEADHVNDKNGW